MPQSWTNDIRNCGRYAFLAIAVVLIFFAPVRINCLQLGELSEMVTVVIDVPVLIDGGSVHDCSGSSDLRDPDGCGACHCSIASALLPDGAPVLPVPLIGKCRPALLTDISADDWSFAPEPPPNLV